MPTTKQLEEIAKLKGLVAYEKSALENHQKDCPICLHTETYCASLNGRRSKLIMAQDDLKHYTVKVLRSGL